MPIPNAAMIGSTPSAWCGGVGKIGPAPIKGIRARYATNDESATGIKLRGRHSNNNSSTASNVAAIGEAKTADIPPAAPATSNVFLSAALE